MRRRVRVSTGIYRDQHGLAAIVTVKGRQTEKRYPPGTSLRVIQDWRQDKARELKALTAPRALRTLSADIKLYLERSADMPSLGDRKRDLKYWETALGGHRQRGAITRDELATVIAGWIQEGYAPQTIRHRRNALARLYRVLDGKGAPNPVKDIDLPSVPDPEPRAVPYAFALRVLDSMRDSKTKIRLRVMLETGMPPKQMAEMQPGDREGDTLLLRRRRKGKGRAPVRVPITPSAVTALKAFALADCWGPFSTSSVYKSLRNACDNLLERATLPPTDEDCVALTDAEKGYLRRLRPYDLRHTFGTEAFRATRNLTIVQKLLGQSSAKTAERYALGAVDEILVHGTKDLADSLAVQQKTGKIEE